MAKLEYVALVTKMLSDRQKRNFTESVEMAINLRHVDLTQPKNRIDTDVSLPHGIGRAIRVGVFARGDVAERAIVAGAYRVMGPDDIETLGDDRSQLAVLARETDYFLSEAPLMPTIGKRLGSVLGRQGKMPQPLPANADIAAIIERLSKSIRLRSKDKATFHVRIGSEAMPAEQLAENVEAVVSKLLSALEKGRYNVASIYVKTTMGKAVRVEV